MTVWRISNHETLDGRGGMRAGGRWHTRGRRIVYCAPNPATALLEVLVHLEVDIDALPKAWKFLEIDVPDYLEREAVDPKQLPRDWPHHVENSRLAGDEWLAAGRTPLLLAPSVLVPATWNILVNPAVPAAAEVRVVRVHRHILDRRLVRA